MSPWQKKLTNDVANRRHFTRTILGTNCNFTPNLEVEILGETFPPSPTFTLTRLEKGCTLEKVIEKRNGKIKKQLKKTNWVRM